VRTQAWSRKLHRLGARPDVYTRVCLGNPLPLLDLCRELDVSERSLHYAFQEVRGLSPMAYFRAFRLNAVRQELKTAPDTATVHEIAQRWGLLAHRGVRGGLPAAVRRVALPDAQRVADGALQGRSPITRQRVVKGPGGHCDERPARRTGSLGPSGLAVAVSAPRSASAPRTGTPPRSGTQRHSSATAPRGAAPARHDCWSARRRHSPRTAS